MLASKFYVKTDFHSKKKEQGDWKNKSRENHRTISFLHVLYRETVKSYNFFLFAGLLKP